jgi:hypothetical protein
MISLWAILRRFQYEEYIESDGRMSDKWLTGKDLKGSGVIEITPGIRLEELRKTMKIVTLASVLTDIRTEHPQNTSPEHDLVINLFPVQNTIHNTQFSRG